MFCDKLKAEIDRGKKELERFEITFGANEIARRGFLEYSEKHAVRLYSGEHYVYVWKHMLGDPFYVGLGTGNRCTAIAPGARNKEFFRHLDEGDAVVYKILDCVDEKTAQMYEKYITYSLTSNGFTLANRDNNACLVSDELKENMEFFVCAMQGETLTNAVEDALIKSVDTTNVYERFPRILQIQQFKKLYGDHFFSSRTTKRKSA